MGRPGLSPEITGKARAAIRRFVRNKERQEIAAIGRQLYEEIAERLPAKIGRKALAAAVKRLGYKTEDELMHAIGSAKIADAALMEALQVDTKRGFFVNHDLAGYEVPVHADIPHQEVVFLDETDPISSPMKAKGVGELGICGVGAAVANAVYNATGVRVRDYPLTLDKLFPRLPEVA